MSEKCDILRHFGTLCNIYENPHNAAIATISANCQPKMSQKKNSALSEILEKAKPAPDIKEGITSSLSIIFIHINVNSNLGLLGIWI